MLEPVLPTDLLPSHPPCDSRPPPRAVIAQREGFPEDAARRGPIPASREPLSTCDNYCHHHPGGLQPGAAPTPAPMVPQRARTPPPPGLRGTFQRHPGPLHTHMWCFPTAPDKEVPHPFPCLRGASAATRAGHAEVAASSKSLGQSRLEWHSTEGAGGGEAACQKPRRRHGCGPGPQPAQSVPSHVCERRPSVVETREPACAAKGALAARRGPRSQALKQEFALKLPRSCLESRIATPGAARPDAGRQACGGFAGKLGALPGSSHLNVPPIPAPRACVLLVPLTHQSMPWCRGTNVAY